MPTGSLHRVLPQPYPKVVKRRQDNEACYRTVAARAPSPLSRMPQSIPTGHVAQQRCPSCNHLQSRRSVEITASPAKDSISRSVRPQFQKPSPMRQQIVPAIRLPNQHHSFQVLALTAEASSQPLPVGSGTEANRDPPLPRFALSAT